MSNEDSYLIWSNEHRMWWGPNGHGYTRDPIRAGRYTHADAVKRSCGRDQEPGTPLPELPVRWEDVMTIITTPWKQAADM